MFLKSVKTKLFPMKTETSSRALTLQRKCFCGRLLWPPPTKLAICCTKSHSSPIHKVKGHGQAVTPSKNGPGMNDEGGAMNLYCFWEEGGQLCHSVTQRLTCCWLVAVLG